MAELLLRELSPELLERLQALAESRGRPPDAVAAELLRQAVGLAPRAVTDLSRIGELLKDNESQVLVEAIAAMEGMPDDTFIGGLAK